MQSPDVTILIAAWNAETTLRRAIESALAQDDVTTQVIVIDDCSTDNTLEVAIDLASKYPMLEVISQPENGGPAAARNQGLAKAQGRFVTVLDSDDYMQPSRIRDLIALADEGSFDIVADDLLRVDQDNPNAPYKRLWSSSDFGHIQIDLEYFINGNLTTANGARGELGFLKPLMRLDFIRTHKLKYDTSLRLGEDYILYAQALGHKARFCLTDPAGYVAVMRTTSLSARHATKDLDALVSACLKFDKDFDLSPSEKRAFEAHLLDTQKRWQWLRLIDAVKQRDIKATMQCFAVDPRVSGSLLGKLAEQAILRSKRKLGLDLV